MTTYTVFNQEDSSVYEGGLTLSEAAKEFWKRNGGRVRDYNDDFTRIASGEDYTFHVVRPEGL
jgi:hypothetical protein